MWAVERKGHAGAHTISRSRRPIAPPHLPRPVLRLALHPACTSHCNRTGPKLLFLQREKFLKGAIIEQAAQLSTPGGSPGRPPCPFHTPLGGLHRPTFVE